MPAVAVIKHCGLVVNGRPLIIAAVHSLALKLYIYRVLCYAVSPCLIDCDADLVIGIGHVQAAALVHAIIGIERIAFGVIIGYI